jgi:hypothetical protein
MTRLTDPGRRLSLFLLGTLLFAVACGQAPLYYSNQNQYFLHGFAAAGQGHLDHDWLANTRDPTPLFTALVAGTLRWLHPWMFYLDYALIQGVYAASLLGLFVFLVGPQVAARRWPVFVLLFVGVHAALVRWASYRWLGQDYPYYLQGGLAGQYILGAMFQPSTFGVFLLAAVVLFLSDRLGWAVACLALAVNVHSTYLLPAGLLTAGFLAALLREGQVARALRLNGLALLAVLPAVLYTWLMFAPTSPDEFARAREILVNVRIPHHCRPRLWLDAIAVLQIGWFGLSLVWARSARLLLVLAVPALLALALTLAQVRTDSTALALLFPWRISSILVPIATAVLLARVVQALPAGVETRTIRVASGITVLLLAIGGGWVMAARQGFHVNDEELPLLRFVRDHQQPGDVYFLPIQIPDLAASTRGSLSSDFKPLAEKKTDQRVLSVDLQRFRLFTGAPIFVDFKSIPYRDTEVLEWYDRLRFTETIWRELHAGRFDRPLAELRARGVTHLIVPAGQKLEHPELLEVYPGDVYRVYRLSPARSGAASDRPGTARPFPGFFVVAAGAASG